MLLCPWGFSGQEYWSGLPCPPPGDLPIPGIEPKFPTLQADSLPSPPGELLATESRRPQSPGEWLLRRVSHQVTDQTHFSRCTSNSSSAMTWPSSLAYLPFFWAQCRLRVGPHKEVFREMKEEMSEYKPVGVEWWMSTDNAGQNSAPKLEAAEVGAGHCPSWAGGGSAAQSCLAPWPHGLQYARPPVFHHLPEFTQIHVHWHENSERLYFLGLQNHCRWWLQPWN